VTNLNSLIFILNLILKYSYCISSSYCQWNGHQCTYCHWQCRHLTATVNILVDSNSQQQEHASRSVDAISYRRYDSVAQNRCLRSTCHRPHTDGQTWLDDWTGVCVCVCHLMQSVFNMRHVGDWQQSTALSTTQHHSCIIWN